MSPASPVKARLPLFASLPTDQLEKLTNTVESLGAVMRFADTRDPDPYRSIEAVLPVLYAEFVRTVPCEDVAAASLDRRVQHFAASLEAFGRSVQERGYFRQLRPTPEVIAHVYKAFCASGAFFFKPEGDEGASPNSYIREISRQAEEQEVRDMQDILFPLNDRTMLAQRAMMRTFEHWLLSDLASSIDMMIGAGRAALEGSQPGGMRSPALDLTAQVETGVGMLDRLRNSARGIESLLGFCQRKGLEFPQEAPWQMLQRQMRAHCHDYANLLSIFMIIAGTLQQEESLLNGMARQVLEQELAALRLSGVSAIFHVVGKLLLREARSRNVGLRQGVTLGISVPLAQRLAIFRFGFGLGLNAVRYADLAKPRPLVRFDARLDGPQLRLRVTDNGVGIADVAAVLAGGWRERPDLSDGEGIGIAGVAELAAEQGWEFDLASRAGCWTRAELVVDTSNWDVGEGSTASSGTFTAVSAPLLQTPVRVR